MGKSRPVVYLDTCVIIEAHRVKCWKQLAAQNELHTVRECYDELAGGNPRDPDYIAVDQRQIALDMAIHDCAPRQRIAAATRAATFGGLDAGEMGLLAWCADQDPQAMIITTGDRAAIVAACELGLRNNLQSLEEIAKGMRPRSTLQRHFCRKWFEEVCRSFALDNIAH